VNLLAVLALGLISASCSDESPEPLPTGNAVTPSMAYDEWLHEEARCGACHTETTGLFRFDGVAVTSFATHAEMAQVTVSQPGRPDCAVGSMHVLDDRQHPTLLELLGNLSDLERELAWSDDPR